MRKDPPIDEIRAVRHTISEEHGHNTKALLSHYKALEEKYKDRMMTRSLSVSQSHRDSGNSLGRNIMEDWGIGPVGDDRIETYGSLEEARERFGENYGAFVFRLTRSQVEELMQGRVVAFDISGREYAGFLVLQEADHVADA